MSAADRFDGGTSPLRSQEAPSSEEGDFNGSDDRWATQIPYKPRTHTQATPIASAAHARPAREHVISALRRDKLGEITMKPLPNKARDEQRRSNQVNGEEKATNVRRANPTLLKERKQDSLKPGNTNHPENEADSLRTERGNNLRTNGKPPGHLKAPRPRSGPRGIDHSDTPKIRTSNAYLEDDCLPDRVVTAPKKQLETLQTAERHQASELPAFLLDELVSHSMGKSANPPSSDRSQPTRAAAQHWSDDQSFATKPAELGNEDGIYSAGGSAVSWSSSSRESSIETVKRLKDEILHSAEDQHVERCGSLEARDGLDTSTDVPLRSARYFPDIPSSSALDSDMEVELPLALESPRSRESVQHRNISDPALPKHQQVLQAAIVQIERSPATHRAPHHSVEVSLEVNRSASGMRQRETIRSSDSVIPASFEGKALSESKILQQDDEDDTSSSGSEILDPYKDYSILVPATYRPSQMTGQNELANNIDTTGQMDHMEEARDEQVINETHLELTPTRSSPYNEARNELENRSSPEVINDLSLKLPSSLPRRSRIEAPEFTQLKDSHRLSQLAKSNRRDFVRDRGADERAGSVSVHQEMGNSTPEPKDPASVPSDLADSDLSSVLNSGRRAERAGRERTIVRESSPFMGSTKTDVPPKETAKYASKRSNETPEQHNIYESFLRQYPTYERSLREFVHACAYLEWLQADPKQVPPHHSLWDDLVRVYSGPYKKHLKDSRESGLKPDSLVIFYDKEVDEPEFTHRIVTKHSLTEAFVIDAILGRAERNRFRRLSRPSVIEKVRTSLSRGQSGEKQMSELIASAKKDAQPAPAAATPRSPAAGSGIERSADVFTPVRLPGAAEVPSFSAPPTTAGGVESQTNESLKKRRRSDMSKSTPLASQASEAVQMTLSQLQQRSIDKKNMKPEVFNALLSNFVPRKRTRR